MNCNKTLFTKEILCSGSMNDYVTIYSRSIKGTSPDEYVASETLTTVWSVFGKMEAISPTFRFDGVNISKGTTHLCYLPYDETIETMDQNTLWLGKQGRVNSTKSKYYKMLGIKNFGEQDEYLILFLQETGFTDKAVNVT